MVKIDPEFESMFPALEREAFEGLTQSIIYEGCRDAIIVWNDTVVDGHNRLSICNTYGIPFQTHDYTDKLKTREDVVDWMIKTQLNRRNITPDEASFYRGELYNRIKKRESNPAGKNQYSNGVGVQSDIQPKTADRVSKDTGVSSATVKRDAAYNEAVKTITKNVGIDTIKNKIITGSVKATRKDIISLSKKDIETQNKVIATVLSEPKKNVKAVTESTIKFDIITHINATSSPDGKYHVVVIDPPWQYSNRSEDTTHRGRNQYPSMTIEEICNVEIPHEENTVLWLWTTNAFMHEAYHVLNKWGFTPKTILTWAKDRMGVGDWLRGQTEHCIMAVCGNPAINLTNQTTILHAPLREHSRKPDEFYNMISVLCPGKKIDMFSREQREGWDQWGGERDKFS